MYMYTWHSAGTQSSSLPLQITACQILPNLLPEAPRHLSPNPSFPLRLPWFNLSVSFPQTITIISKYDLGWRVFSLCLPISAMSPFSLHPSLSCSVNPETDPCSLFRGHFLARSSAHCPRKAPGDMIGALPAPFLLQAMSCQ